MKFRKKPVVIEAVQLKWSTWSEVCEFAKVGAEASGQPYGVYIEDGKATKNPTNVCGLMIPTLEGNMLAVEDDWIIRGVKGELYPCKPDIFAATYEKAD